MREQLLQFIWQFQYFNNGALCTTAGESLRILAPGELNTGQGPDFLNGQVQIGGVRWYGNIELHIRRSDWDKHAHQHDQHYRNVILHVVWEDDGATAAAGIPLLVLQDRVPKLLLGRYEEWMNNRKFIACEGQVGLAPGKVWDKWKGQMLTQRLERKYRTIMACLRENQQHWEETLWWQMARNFGLPVNGDAFEAIARSLPLAMLARHAGRLDQLEALLLGQAGLLEEHPGYGKQEHPGHGKDGRAGLVEDAQEERDEYRQNLQMEYRHLRNKYGLSATYAPVLFLRMRPGNLPTVRLAQLAAVLHGSMRWLGRILEAETPGEVKAYLHVRASGYWDEHYVLGTGAGRKVKWLGEAMKDSLLINTFIPVLYAYGSWYGENGQRQKAFRWLEAIAAEKNAQVAGWGSLGVRSNHAADTQALLELKKHYCGAKKCLVCAVGKALLTLPREGK